MAVVERLRRFLDEQGVSYEVTVHPERYTAQEVAAASHVSGRALAKTVMVKTGGGFAMAVLPAACRMSVQRVRDLLGDPGAAIAGEGEFRDLFADCEAGAMPPFGNLYGIPVYVDDELAVRERITFEAGTHHEVITMRYADFARVVQPRQAEFCAHAA
jgi:Ala-tRNA(Pro) deacylase